MSDQPNNQNLPEGLGNRAAAAAQQPQQPAPAPQYDQQYPVQEPAQQPAPQQPQHNPMLSRMQAPPAPDQQPMQPAPAQAPAQPQAPAEPEPVQGAPADASGLAGEWGKDPNVAPAVSYLEAVSQDKNLDFDRAFGNAQREGDARFIDKNYLKEVYGDQAEQVAKTAESLIEYANSQVEANTKAVYDLAGGEATWQQAAQHFKANGDPTEVAAMQRLMNSGDRSSIEYAARKIMESATQAGAVVRHNQQAVGQNGGARGLSRSEYIEAIGQRNVSPEQYESLKQQRLLGKQQGL